MVWIEAFNFAFNIWIPFFVATYAIGVGAEYMIRKYKEKKQ